MRVAAILGSPILILFHTAPHILANQPTIFYVYRQRLVRRTKEVIIWRFGTNQMWTARRHTPRVARALEGRLYLGCIRLPPFKGVGWLEYILPSFPPGSTKS